MADTTAPVKSTAAPAQRAFEWAVHWVHPSAAVLPLREGKTKLGRDKSSDWVLDDEQASREHATLVVSGATCSILDLGSSNGVHVDRERVRDSRLADGSVLRCGNSVGVVVYAGGAKLAPSTLATFERQPYVGSGKLQSVVEHAKLLAQLDDPVLIQGETGTGKEVVASLLHESSPQRRRGKLIALNCARLQPNLAASELFGHVRGAFSGADHAHVGAAVRADGGTLFLDEVAELGPDVQATLLRFLATGEVTPVGGSSSSRSNARIVSATHGELRALGRSDAFREDLFHRLAVHRLALPALRERKEDILSLFEHFAKRPRAAMSAGFVVELLLAEWRGNVRELKNAAARLAAAHGAEPMWSHHLASHARALVEEPARDRAARELGRKDWVELFEAHRGNAAQIARATGFSVSSVKRYLEQHGVKG
ncbi:MAG TPA: sigma 54-interacting transcriptional regulator [Polyangiaceae bacterium]|nr:sigma 54-interacting transcriptional regulator [Polyangiaceae bacterium]